MEGARPTQLALSGPILTMAETGNKGLHSWSMDREGLTMAVNTRLTSCPLGPSSLARNPACSESLAIQDTQKGISGIV